MYPPTNIIGICLCNILIMYYNKQVGIKKYHQNLMNTACEYIYKNRLLCIIYIGRYLLHMMMQSILAFARSFNVKDNSIESIVDINTKNIFQKSESQVATFLSKTKSHWPLFMQHHLCPSVLACYCLPSAILC